MEHSTDFVATELLRELKLENGRKDTQVRRLQATLIAIVMAAFASLLLVVGVFIWYLNQYDFSATSTITNDYSTVQTAEGVYAVIDGEGNVIGQDLSSAQLTALLEELEHGESD